MIDFEAFLRESCKPFSAEGSNCATAMVAAFKHPPKLARALAEWAAETPLDRERIVSEFAATGAHGLTLPERFGFAPADPKGTAPAWGVLCAGAVHAFAVYDGARWYVRAPKGIKRVSPRYVVGAWGVE